MAQADRIMEAVNEVVRSLGGSFSAEHGIGSLKAGMLPSWHSAEEMRLMQRLKQAFDPEGLLNPGKVIAEPPG